jgi:hypothetical protein
VVDLVQATPEDVIGSIVLIGPPRRQLRAFNDKNLLSGQGELDLTCGEEMVVEVADLGTTAPTSVPSGRVTVPVAPQGSYGLGHHVTSFSDEISSLTLGWA